MAKPAIALSGKVGFRVWKGIFVTGMAGYIIANGDGSITRKTVSGIGVTDEMNYPKSNGFYCGVGLSYKYSITTKLSIIAEASYNTSWLKFKDNNYWNFDNYQASYIPVTIGIGYKFKSK
jgi:opacity protein-like surface antigen